MDTQHIEEKNKWLEQVIVHNNKNIYTKDGLYSVNTNLHSAPEHIQKDKDVVLAALLKGHEFLWAIDMSFRNDRNFILELMASDYPCDIYAGLSKELRAQEDMFKLCIMRDKEISYRSIPLSILKNKSLILFAAQHIDIYLALENAKSYKEINYSLDKEVMSAVIEHNPEHFSKLMKSMKKYLFKNTNLMIKVMRNSQNSREYEALPISLKHNQDLTINYLYATSNYEKIPQELKDNREFNLRVLNETYLLLSNFPAHFKSDFEFVKCAISNDYRNFYYMAEHLNSNKELAELALISKKPGSVISALSPELLEDKELILKFLKLEPYDYKHLNNHLAYDFDIGMCVLENSSRRYGGLYYYLKPELKQNTNIIISMLKNNDSDNNHYADIRKSNEDLRTLTNEQIQTVINTRLFAEKLNNSLETKSITHKKIKV